MGFHSPAHKQSLADLLRTAEKFALATQADGVTTTLETLVPDEEVQTAEAQNPSPVGTEGTRLLVVAGFNQRGWGM